MRDVDPASINRTYEEVGAQFICSVAPNGRDSRCDVKMIVTSRTVRLIASDLLEQTGDWWTALRDLPADVPIPPGVADAIRAAYDASLAWVELLDRKPTDRVSLTATTQGETR